MENYILRIYRRDPQQPDCVVGMLEDAASGETLAFHSLDQLMAYLSQREPQAAREPGRRLKLV